MIMQKVILMTTMYIFAFEIDLKYQVFLTLTLTPPELAAEMPPKNVVRSNWKGFLHEMWVGGRVVDI